jgi:hypothetical protein
MVPSSSILAQGATLFLLIIALAAGIGMWSGKKWGWWLGSLDQLNSALSNASAMLIIPHLLDRVGVSSAVLADQISQIGIKAALHSVLLLYLFLGSIIEFFQVGDVAALKRLLILFAAVAVIMGLFSLLSLVLG